MSQIDFLRPQYIRKSKQISGKTILSSPHDGEFNPNFAKNRDIPVVKNIVTRPVTLSTFYSMLITCQIQAYNLYYIFQYTYLIQKSHFFGYIVYIVQNCPKVGFFERGRQDVDDQDQRKQTLTSTVACFIRVKHPSNQDTFFLASFLFRCITIRLIKVHCNERFRKHSFRSTMKHHHQKQIAKNSRLQPEFHPITSSRYLLPQ